MGTYVNPSDMEKEEWLVKNGAMVASPKLANAAFAFESAEKNGDYLVCLVNNGFFSAAGVADSVQELEAFAHPDGREKLWFQVSKEKLKEVAA